MNRKEIIFAIICGIIAFIAIFLVARPHMAGANGSSEEDVPGKECEQQAPENNPHCDDISPTVSPTPTIPVYQCYEDDCIEVTPTPTEEPSVTPTPTETPNEGGPGDGLHTGGDGLHTGPDGLGCATHECKDNGFGTGNPNWDKLPLK